MKRAIVGFLMTLLSLCSQAQSYYVGQALIGDKKHLFSFHTSQVYILEGEIRIALGGEVRKNIHRPIKKIYERESPVVRTVTYETSLGPLTYVHYKKYRYSTLTGFIIHRVPMVLYLYSTTDGY